MLHQPASFFSKRVFNPPGRSDINCARAARPKPRRLTQALNGKSCQSEARKRLSCGSAERHGSFVSRCATSRKRRILDCGAPGLSEQLQSLSRRCRKVHRPIKEGAHQRAWSRASPAVQYASPARTARSISRPEGRGNSRSHAPLSRPFPGGCTGSGRVPVSALATMSGRTFIERCPVSFRMP